MSNKQIYRCDRCEKKSASPGTNNWISAIVQEHIGMVQARLSGESRVLDLCGRCAKAFKLFLDGRP